MARYYGLRSLLIFPLLGALATFVMTMISPTVGTSWPSHLRVTTHEPAFSFSLVDFAMPASDEIRLQAAIAEESPLAKDPATLNGLLRSIDIRTALEDTQRLRFELG